MHASGTPDKSLESSRGARAEASAQGSPTPEQRRAIEHREGPLVVLAGPGSGKTRVISQRVASLIEEGATPESIVAVTFTTKAAGELRERVHALVGPSKADRVRACTFHALGLHLLMRFGDEIAIPASPNIIDSAQARRLMRELVSSEPQPDAEVAGGWGPLIDRCLQLFAQLRHHAIEPARALEHVRSWRERIAKNPEKWDGVMLRAQRAECERFATVARLFDRFERECQRRGWITLDHLLTTPSRLLDQRPGVAAIVRSDWRHFVVDEFQDVNLAQIELLRRLAPPDNKPDLCVVGDDDQSIYAFRGADDRAFHRFSQIWRGHATVALSGNFRSVPEVVSASNSVIARARERYAPDKSSRATRPSIPGGGVECVELRHDMDDAATIARMILLDRAGRPESDRSWKRYAVIARSHGDLDRVERALRLENVPVVLARRASARENEGVLDLLAWAELLTEPDAIQPAKRLLARPPYSASAADLIAWEQAYRAARSRWELENAAPGSGPIPAEATSSGTRRGRSDVPTFLAWLTERHGAESIPGRLARQVESIGRDVLTRSADAALLAIVHRADLAHADLVADVRRARRIAALVSVVRFSRDRLDRLDAPGDLAAWRRYVNDLQGEEANFREIGIDPPEAEQASDEDGVRLLTAHGSKGLEFPVVFVPRVSPRVGYPKGGESEEPLPEGLVDRAGETRSVKERSGAEERRIFYVACTRAMDRLVLLAKKNKSPSQSVHFFEEFTRDSEGRKRVEIASGEDVARQALDAGVVSTLADADDLDGSEGSAGLLERAKRAARAAAAEALNAADRRGHDEKSMKQLEASTHGPMRRLAAIAHLESAGELPSWAGEDRALAALAERWRNRAAAEQARSLLAPPPKPPLRLSYTQVNDYLNCPGCYYMTHVLGLREPSSKDAAIGIAVHRALEGFAREWRQADADGVFKPSQERLVQLGRESLVRATPFNRAVEPEHVARVESLLRLAHGHFTDESVGILEIERTVQFPYKVGEHEHTFEAKIDRIDQLADGRLRIVDYKTGQARKGITAPAADDLQMGIYQMALAALVPEGAENAVGEYWVLTAGSRGVLDFAGLNKVKVRARIDEAIGGILRGEFSPCKEHVREGRFGNWPCLMLREREREG